MKITWKGKGKHFIRTEFQKSKNLIYYTEDKLIKFSWATMIFIKPEYWEHSISQISLLIFHYKYDRRHKQTSRNWKTNSHFLKIHFERGHFSKESDNLNLLVDPVCTCPQVFCKKVFLEISQNSQENICVRASLSPKLQALENRKVFWCFQGAEKGCIGNEWVQILKRKLLGSKYALRVFNKNTRLVSLMVCWICSSWRH